MAATITAQATTYTSGVSSYSANAPSGATTGDFLIAVSFCDNDGSEASLTASGWTQLSSSAGTGPGTANTAGFAKLWSRTATSAATYTFGSNAAAASFCIMAKVTGHDTGTPITGTITWSHPTIASATSLIAPSVTPSVAGMLVCCWTQEGVSSGATITKPASMTGTSTVDTVPFLASLLAQESVSSGATGTRTATASGAGGTATQGYLTLSFVIADASGAFTGSATATTTATATTVGVKGIVGAATATTTASVTTVGVLGTTPFPKAPLALQVELFYSGIWNDITSYVQRRESDGIRIVRGKADEAGTLEPSSARLMLNNRDGRFSPRNPTGPLYGLIGRNTPIRCSIIGASFLQINQASGTTVGTANVSTPDNAALDITGDIDLRFDADFDTWTVPSRIDLISKWTTSGNQRAYALTLEETGFGVGLAIWWSTNGTNTFAVYSVPLPVTAGRLTVRATLDVNNGSGGYTATFYYGTDGVDGSFTQFWQTVTTAGTTSIFSSSATMHLLDNPNETDLSSYTNHGKVYGAQVRSSIGGTVVANPDLTDQLEGSTSFTDSVSRAWTVNGDLLLTTKDSRFVNEVTVWPQKWDTTGTDVYVPLECAGILRRISQGTAPLRSALYRGIVNQTATVAYWPCEDLDGSTSVASALSPGKPMTLTGGVPDFASESGFAASAPILQVNGTALHGLVESFTVTNFGQVQFLLYIPAAGTVNNAIIARVNTGGTAAWWDLIYTTGGAVTLTPYDSAGTALTGSGPIAFALDGKYVRFSLELTQNGANIDWKMVTLEPGSATGLAQTGTLNSRTITRVTKVTVNPNREMLDVAVGHVSVYKSLRDIFNLSSELKAWAGETAGRRIERLCEEIDVPFVGKGNLDDSVQMGAQSPGEFRNLVQECVDADLGQLYEPRDALALGYIPSSVLYTQPVDLTLDYTSFQLAELEPVEDDQQLRNDVTVTRTSGTSFRSTLSSGALSLLPPPNGVGAYDTSVTVNLFEDAQVPHAAGWRVRLGTVDEARYPRIAVNLAHPQFFDNALLASARSIDVSNRIAVTNLPTWLPPDAVSAVVQGYEEFLSNFENTVTWNCSPSLPYDTVGFYSSTTINAVNVARYSPDVDSTLNGAHDSTTTSLSVATSSGALWITTALVPADFPFDIRVAGERMTVTAASGTSSPQTFTVTRSVNGVVKAHVTGAVVELWTPTYYAL